MGSYGLCFSSQSLRLIYQNKLTKKSQKAPILHQFLLEVLGDESLKTIAGEQVETVGRKVTIDWTVKKSTVGWAQPTSRWVPHGERCFIGMRQDKC